MNVTDLQHINREDMTSSGNRATAKVYTDTLFPACPHAHELANKGGEDDYIQDDRLALRPPPSFTMRRKSIRQYHLRRDVVRRKDRNRVGLRGR